MRSRTAAKPITIASSSSGQSSRSRRDSEEDINNAELEDSSAAAAAAPAIGFHIHDSNNFDEIHSGMGGLTVGSLPSVRRVRRSVVSSGGNEAMFGSSGGHVGGGGQHWAQQQQKRQGADMMARSMPVPSAPFLRSRRPHGSASNLVSIPALNLTESAAEDEIDSTPYGSLRQSAFNNRPSNLSTSLGGFQSQPLNRFTNNSNQSPPSFNRGGSLGSLLNRDEKSPPTKLDTSGAGGGGIGGAFSSHQYYNSPTDSSNNDVADSHAHSADTNDRIGAEVINHNNEQHHNNIHSISSGLTASRDETTGTEHRLGSSMTGLDILRSSPRNGLGVILTPEQRESLLQRAARTEHIDDPNDTNNFRSSSDEYLPNHGSYSSPAHISQSLSSGTMLLAPPAERTEGIGIGLDRNAPSPNALIPPGQHYAERFNQTVNAAEYDHNRSSSQDEIFDMDE